VLRLTVTLSNFVNYFAPLSHGERTPVTRDQVWSGLRSHRRLARAAKKQLVERQIAEDTQVEQDESLTRNTWAVKQMYEFCVLHNLPNLWAYLWENWYRRGRWELWARSGNPTEIPRLKTTMLVEGQ
jgi:hypothetical protein